MELPSVRIYVDRDKQSFFIKDDGLGMTAEDFQNKFLKIGYSKRKDGTKRSPAGRPFIGRKGIGKLALLSRADKITVTDLPSVASDDAATILGKAFFTPKDFEQGASTACAIRGLSAMTRRKMFLRSLNQCYAD